MPCDSSHLEPTRREREQKEAAELIILVYRFNGKEVPKWAEQAANDCYGSCEHGPEDIIAKLCHLLRSMTDKRRDQMLYSNARDRNRRRLADWWERHLEDDKAREELEKRQRQEILRAQAIRKLTPEEREALGL